MQDEILPPQLLSDMRAVYGGYIGTNEPRRVHDLLKLYRKDFKGFVAMMMPLERDFLRVQERGREVAVVSPGSDDTMAPDEAQRLTERELDQCLVESRLHFAQEAARQPRLAAPDCEAGGGI